MDEYWFQFILSCWICRIENYLISESILFAWPEQFYSVFSNRMTRDRFAFKRARVSASGSPVFEMGEYAGALARIISSFHCLQNESNEKDAEKTQSTRDSPDFPLVSEADTVIVEQAETSQATNLNVLHVAVVDEPISKDDLVVVAKNMRVASQECLLSSRNKRSVVLETLLYHRLVALSWEGLEKIVEVDPSEMLALLEESNVRHRDDVRKVVERDEQLKVGVTDRILRSELAEGISVGVNKRLSSEVDVAMLGEPAFVSKKLPEQRRRHAQYPRIDLGKTHHGTVANF